MSFSTRFRAGQQLPCIWLLRIAPSMDKVFPERRAKQSPRAGLHAFRHPREQNFRVAHDASDVIRRGLNVLQPRERARRPPGINGNTHQVFGLFDSMFPLIPSAGLLLEF